MDVMSEPQVTIVQADLARTDHQEVVLQLLNGYASDPMGDGKPLSEQARRDLIPRLRQHPTTIIFLAYADDAPVGLAICFLGFSTFAARPLINIHDFYVVASSRGSGVGRRLMEEIERHARDLGCCKLTLEVLENNRRARSLYAAAGFGPSTYTPEAGEGLFLVKPL
jgi:GNAT superfamily N-acetyltransferase